MFFDKCQTIEQVKKQYKKLCFKYHPDRNQGNKKASDIMKLVNREYDDAIQQAYSYEKSKGKKVKFSQRNENKFKSIINKIVNITDIQIKIVGSWIWIDGNTYPIKQQLKDIGFRWSTSRKKWYYGGLKHYHNKNYRSNFKKFSDIENYYGVTKVEKEKNKQLQ